MESVSTTVCSIAKPKNIKNFLDYEILIASHDWKLERTEEHGRHGVLVTMKCKKCHADRISVFSSQEPGPPSY
jgi:hypothetical protein